MTEFTEEKLAELRAVAEAATQGPWELVAGGEYMPATGLVVAPDDGGVSPNNAAHISAFDPPTVLRLIAALEAKTAEVERVKALHRPEPFYDEPSKQFCIVCQVSSGVWPCATIQAIERTRTS